jgi:hypothetical protein
LFHKIKILFAVLVSAVMFSACSDDPTSLGNNYMSNQLVGITKVSCDSLQTSSVVDKNVSLGLAARLMLGKYNGTESSVLMKFDLTSCADSIITGVKNGTMSVEFAKVIMVKSYVIGNKTGAFSFTAHNCTNAWTNSVTKDSLGAIGYSSEDVVVAHTDADSTYSFFINPSTVKGWFGGTNYGVFLKPDAGCQKIIGFNGLSISLSSTEYTQLILGIRNTGKVVDTLSSICPYYDVHIPVVKVPARNSSNMYVMGTAAVNSRLRFDLSSFPAHAMALNATLEIDVDSAACVTGSPRNDTLACRFLYSGSEISYDTSNAVILQRQNNKFVGDVTKFVQRWLQNETNYGVLLSLGYETASLDFLSLYGSTAEKSKRPKLNIFYSFKK